MERQFGEVSYWNKTKAIGFINGFSDRRSYFFHITYLALENGAREIPSPGDLYTFAIRQSSRYPDKQEAIDLRLSKRATATPTMPAPVAGTSEVKL